MLIFQERHHIWQLQPADRPEPLVTIQSILHLIFAQNFYWMKLTAAWSLYGLHTIDSFFLGTPVSNQTLKTGYLEFVRNL